MAHILSIMIWSVFPKCSLFPSYKPFYCFFFLRGGSRLPLDRKLEDLDWRWVAHVFAANYGPPSAKTYVPPIANTLFSESFAYGFDIWFERKKLGGSGQNCFGISRNFSELLWIFRFCLLGVWVQLQTKVILKENRRERKIINVTRLTHVAF